MRGTNNLSLEFTDLKIKDSTQGAAKEGLCLDLGGGVLDLEPETDAIQTRYLGVSGEKECILHIGSAAITCGWRADCYGFKTCSQFFDMLAIK